MDPYFHRDLTLRVGDRRLALAVSQELFSSHTIDTGTLRLLKSFDRLDPPADVLDLGCGYGPLAIAAAVRWPDARIEAVDRDALALDYTAANAERAGVAVDVHGSVGTDDVDGAFDLIVSNVPGKGSLGFHRDLLEQLAARLRPDGLLAIVVVNPLVPAVEAFGAEELLRDTGKEHTVFHLRPTVRPVPRSSFERGIYDRGRVGDARTVHGIGEFDSLGYHTELALHLLHKHGGPRGEVVVVNPGQGHLAMAAGATQLVDRDLLALRTTARNLGRPVRTRHACLPDPTAAAELGILSLRRKEPAAVHRAQRDALAAALGDGGTLLVTGTATVLDRVAAGCRVRAQQRRHGHAAAILEGISPSS